MPKAVAFLSDFGLADEFVGVVKGVIARIDPDVRVTDITHGIAAGDVRGGGLALLRAIQYLPRGVVLAVVDPGVGSSRRAVALETEWGEFVGPDNGLLAPAVAMVGGATRAVALDNPDFHVPSEGGSTFDGRDVFGPAAAVLASGQARLTDLGTSVDPDSLTPLLLPLVELEEDAVIGKAWWVDHFGNVQTNISPDDLATLGVGAGDRLQIRIGEVEHFLPYVESYSAVDPGRPLMHVDSYGLVALAVRDGRASDELEVGAGTVVTVRRLAGS
jgi:S-adenosylmethionine hydrolase